MTFVDVADSEPAHRAHDTASNCLCIDQADCRCPSSSSTPMNNMFKSSLDIIRDIFLGHHITRSRTSVFHSDLPAIQHALQLHRIPHSDMTLIECRRALIHHIITGACYDNPLNTGDVPPSSAHLELGTCRAVSQGYVSAADVSEAALKVILDADHKQMLTENYCHVAAAMNITTSGTRNICFKLRAAIREHLMKISQEESDNRSSASVADFFNSFESYRKPVLVAIAAFHRIELPEKATVEHTRTKITEHIISGHCAQFAGSHSSNSLPPDISLSDCADVCKEWKVNVIHPDLQVHILSAFNGSNLTLNPLRRILSGLNIEHTNSESSRELKNKLKSYISMLCKGKRVERATDKRAEDNHIKKTEARARYDEELGKIIASWPQLVPQSLKDKVINIFRDQTSSEARATFTCASCAESSSLPLLIVSDEFNGGILMRPDLKLNEEYLLDLCK
ncbi:hypothetical protein DFH09DRAFT_1088894 [Mycena vulgaris]|nr:hypothetical protein DFH09DRAFT_1088894 [Mycena vulgaris]